MLSTADTAVNSVFIRFYINEIICFDKFSVPYHEPKYLQKQVLFWTNSSVGENSL